VAIVIAGCGGSDSDDTTGSSEAVIQLDSVPGIGRVLVNASGQTLYRSTFDLKWDTVTHCNGACAKIWRPELTATRPEAGPGIEAGKLGTLKRRDGTLQATYDGWPLYSYTREEPLESQGVGLLSAGKTWYALAGAKAVSVEKK
jgi:predicted lipoprotein with Yx(FWY)xxD motif